MSLVFILAFMDLILGMTFICLVLLIVRTAILLADINKHMDSKIESKKRGMK